MQVVAFECMHYIQVVVGVFLPSWFNTLTLDSWIYTVWFKIHVRKSLCKLLDIEVTNIYLNYIIYTNNLSTSYGGYFIDDS